MAFGFGDAPAPRAPDPRDQTENYNTPLGPNEEAAFQAYIAKAGKSADLSDYDLRGAWKHDAKAAENGHLPDNWKKPNHPTFSDESIYSGPYATGGKWQELPGGKWRFEASQDNLRYQSPADLQAYFGRVEPESELLLPRPVAPPSAKPFGFGS